MVAILTRAFNTWHEHTATHRCAWPLHGPITGSLLPHLANHAHHLLMQVCAEMGLSMPSNPRKSPDCSTSSLPDALVSEVVRYGAGELHVVGAFMGGVAAQEAIKVVARQFLPATGTIIYNAVHCTVTLLDL